MNDMMKECFTPHALMHNLFGIGLGIVLATVVTGLQNVWIGVGCIVVALVLDATRKK